MGNSNRQYYSMRIGKNPMPKLNLSSILRIFSDLFMDFSEREYFQESFGYDCVDQGFVPGSLGAHIEAQIYRRLRKDNLYPFNKIPEYSEEDLFDVIELLYDLVSKPIDGYEHTYSSCGWHYHTFNKLEGQKEFRDQINKILCDYNEGFELSTEGEIYSLVNDGLTDLLTSVLPPHDENNVNNRVQIAIKKFRNRHSSLDDQRVAIRDLADVLEFLRNEIKELIDLGLITHQDESDLFNLANNFGIRHHNVNQKTDYDKEIWYPWLFYYYLATIHAIIAFIDKNDDF